MSKLENLIKLKKLTRNYSFARQGLGLNGVQDILSCVGEGRRFSQIYKISKIHFKKSFIKYLKFCVDKKLVRHWTVYGTKGKNIYKPLESWYVITDKGRLFLEMLE